MKRRKNLERAVILGLLLSTSVYGNAFAASVDVDDFVNGKTGAITVTEDTTVIGDGRQNGDSDTIGNSLFSYVDGVRYNNTVTVSNEAALQFDNVALNNAVITSNGKLSINANIDGMKAGLYLDANVKADELIINATATGAKGIYAYNADRNNVNNGNILIDVEKNVQVTSNADGIYTEAYKDNDIDINAAGLTVVTDSRGGIYNNIGENNHIRIDVGDGTVSVTSGDTTGKYGSIINKNSGDTTIDAGTIIINADTSNGVYATDGTINLNAKKDNQINGQVGIKAEGGTVNVTATNGNNIITANMNGIYASGENSVVNLIGNVNKITVNGTDKTTKNNAILAENNSTINIVDGGNLELNLNKTPYYIDDPAAGDNVSGLRNYGSNLNINTGNGFVDINVVSNTIKHMSESTGISLNTWATTDGANYGDATTTISGKYVDINVSNNIQNVSGNIVTSGAVYGIHLNDSDKENEKRANLTLTANGYYTDTINEEERNIGINIIANNDGYASDPKSATAVGVKLNGNAEAVITANSGDVNISANSKNSYGYGIQANGYANSATNLNITGVNTNINGSYAAAFIQGSLGENTKTEVKLKATGGNNKFKGESFGIYNQYGASTEIEAISGFNSVVAGNSGTAIYSYGKDTTVKLIAKGNSLSANTGIWGTNNGQVTLTANNENNEIITSVNGIFADSASKVNLTATQGTNKIDSNGSAIYSAGENTIVKLESIYNTIEAETYGIDARSAANVNLTAVGTNKIDSNDIGISSNNSGTKVNLNALDNYIKATDHGVYANKDGAVNITSDYSNQIISSNIGIGSYNGNVELKSTIDKNIIEATYYGIYANHDDNDYDTNTVKISGTTNSLTATSGYGIYATGGITDVNLTAKSNNNILAAKTTIVDEETGSAVDYGKQSAIYALSGSDVDLLANGQNYLMGSVYAKDADTTVDLKGKDDGSVINVVRSYAVIAGAGDLNTDEGFKDKKVVSALYAQDGANIKLTGENYIGTYADNTDTSTLERTVWAYKKGTIDINGAAQIGTDRYSTSPNSLDIAIAAGTAVDLDEKLVNTAIDDKDRATVTLKYDNFADGYRKSSITGDILSAYAGNVKIDSDNSNAGINITGNLLSGNNGKMSVDLGNGGSLEGRIDDYGDAGTTAESGHLKFFDPAFSSDIYSGGEVNLDMGDGSYWNVTGQSWVTTLTGNGSVIDMRNDNDDLSGEGSETDNNSHAVHVGTLTGNNTFVMDLNDTNHNVSDMLYIKDETHSRGTQTVFLNSVEGLENMKDGDKLRFATVNAGTDQLIFEGEYEGENGYTNAKSRVMLYDAGFNNVAFEVKNEVYSEADNENKDYNGADFDETKPGNAYVNEAYGDGAINWYLEKNSSGDEMSDGGETILNMSRANYSNAIYMDRLNKRLGEARYINDDPEEDEGMWVRIRHDRIGKNDAFRSQNTMYQLGYDKRQDCDNGERRVGFAVDYMHGDTGYTDIAGKGEIDRYGLWLYDTWMGDKGHYVDYIAKWGHLDNDFEIYAPTTGERIDGDYSNNVFSVSAEYGRKKDIGNDWYFEPQAQLQLARVTGADYTTSQGTKVSVDGINSLIGRAGFRIGKDFGEEKQSTLYFKADVLHEFLGDQDISAMDKTTNGNWSTISYENEGTWYDIGIGYAAMMSKSSYAFIDLEQSFGNDNDDTYQINAGVRWTF